MSPRKYSRPARLLSAVLAGGAMIACSADSTSGPTSIATAGSAQLLFSNTHEPTGMTAVVSQAFNSTTLASWYSLPAGVRLLSDTSTPLSPAPYGRMIYPAGFKGGVAPATTTSTSFAGKGYKEVYVRLGVRLSSNFFGHPTSTNKVVHFWIYNPQANRVFLSFEGAGANPLHLQVRCQGSPDDGKCGHLRANTGASGVVTRGAWHVVEVRVRANTQGLSNGVVEAWIDGVRTHFYNNIRLDVGGWMLMSWSPTWGGVGGTVPAAMSMDMDHIYVSGRR